MAGIGFQLKKLVDNGKNYSSLRAFAYSSIIISGPMIFCIIQLLIGQRLLVESGSSFTEREYLLTGTMYSFVCSQLLTGGFLMIVTRYVSDQIYLKKEENILSSLYGVIAIIVLIGGMAAFAFYAISPLGVFFKIVAFLFFMELLIVNILAIYISAVKKYMQIVKAYGLGALTAGFSMWICLQLMDYLKAEHLLACMAAGFIVAIVFLIYSVQERFPRANQNSFDFLSYIQQYPSLFFIGFFYSLSLFGHIFIVWSSDIQAVVGNTFIMAPFYDVPVFYAYLTLIPAMVMFVVSMETAFYKVYKRFYEKVEGENSLHQISEAKTKMFQVLSRELVYIMEFQLVFTILAIVLGATVIPLSTEQIHIYNLLVIGNYFFIIMFILMQILLYFDDRKGALMVISSYMTVSLLSMTAIILAGGNYGLAGFCSGLIGLIVAFWRIYHYGKNIEYYTYCTQPLFANEKTNFLARMALRMNERNGGERGK